MRLRRVLCAFIGLTALCVAPGAVAGAGARPSVRLVDLAPITVKGTRFERRERVRVTLEIDDRTVRRIRASRAGGFRVSFAGTAVDRCNEDVLVIARGSKGSRADAKLAMLQCPPAL